MTPVELRAFRVKNNLTLAQAGNIAMVSARIVREWESGARPIPPYRVKLLRLAMRQRG